ENSESLRQLDPLWEAVQLRVATLEERSLLSEDFDMARKSLQAQRDSLQSSLDNLVDAWNFEVTKGETLQQTIIQILLGVDIAVFFVVLFVIRQSLNPISVITSALSRVKEGVYGERIVYNAKDEVGELVSTFNIMSDTIKQKEEEARKNDQAKDEFLAMITHELKTPLVPIQGYADILLSEHLGALTDKQKERLQIIKSSSESLLDIISDLLDAQKLELGQLRMKLESHSLQDTINKSIEALKPQADRNGVKLSSVGEDVVVLHDPERMGQVLTNLIKNSLNAVKPNTGVIEIITEEDNDSVIISVKDNGIGIPDDKQKDLFKKFYQVDATLTRERGGSGLGLAICKGIVEGHDGEISVKSALNVGTTFTIKIPKSKRRAKQIKQQ
ncbi:MAG: HAMP domain-containing sensor histidine kinase, partial [Nitrosopumilaceae archaeon]|nr:HAMP domain-containing sensor histidine kinase [Nitrosopumilaceae archaeon]